MTADGIYRILLGETIKIGLQIDIMAFADFLCVLYILFLFYFILLFWKKRAKKACIIRIAISVFVIIAAIIVPLIFHYPYSVMYVWYPLTGIIAVIITAFAAISSIIHSIYLLR